MRTAGNPSARHSEHALKAVGLLFEPEAVIEIRALEFRRQPDYAGITYAGYFNFENQQAIAHAVQSMDGRAEGVYVVLNKINPELLARANNRLKARLKHTTTNADITLRRWLYIDADAIRPAGMSATEAEQQAALDRALSIRTFLSGRGWPEPIFADSGNGGHLHYRLPPLPLDAAGDLVKRCLQALSRRSSDAAVQVDETTATAARMCKLYGTLACKGDSLPERPHRRSRILETPKRIEVVSIEALEQLAAEVPTATRAASVIDRQDLQFGHRFDIEAWLAQSGLDMVKGPEAYEGGKKWTLRQCPFNPQHDKPVVIELMSGALVYRCLHRSCDQNDWKALRSHVESSYRPQKDKDVPQDIVPAAIDLTKQPMTDSGNAERILALFGQQIRYCHEMKKFLVYDGQAWHPDNGRRVSHLAKKTARMLFAQAVDLPETQGQNEYRKTVEKFARKSESAKGRKDGLECLAAEQEGLPISESELDPDPWKLNTISGTIDLRTGEIRRHEPTDFISKIVPIEYDPQAQCPRFMRFLQEIMGVAPESGKNEKEHADEIISYLQKAFGCAATGVPEKVLFILYGEGNNGKTTLVEIVRAALGDKEYAGEINIESLMVRPKGAFSSNAINSDLADLRGCRFVSSSEVEQGQRLSLSRVNYLTGLGQIKARRLGQDWITFKPTHKLFLDCNHKPVINDPNDAIWNRVKCIPFTFTIDKIDPRLPAKLRLELPGILRWIVEGAARYHREGLGDPPIVQTATESYRRDSDRMKDFLEEQCILAPDGDAGAWKKNKHWVCGTDLYSSYATWAQECGEKYPLSKSVFDQRLYKLGRREDRVRPNGGRESKQVRVWLGIRFRTPEDD